MSRIAVVVVVAAALSPVAGGAPASPPRTVSPTPAIVTGADAGGGSHVRGWSATGARLPQPDFMAYSTYAGGVRVASGDVDGDGRPEIVTGPGPSGRAEVRVFDALTHRLIRELHSFDWNGGVFVASGDLTGDGKAEVIAGADAGGGSDIQVFGGADGRRTAWFTTHFADRGVRVAAGDVNGDERAEIVAAPGLGGPARVELNAGDGGNACGCGAGAPFRTLTAFGSDVTDGIAVATGDVNGDRRAEVIVGGVTSTGPQVKVLDAATGAALASFFPYGADFQGSLYVAAGDLWGGGSTLIVTSARTTGGSKFRTFDAQGEPMGSFFSLDPALAPGPSVAIGGGRIIAGGGPSFGDQRVTEFAPSGEVVSGFLAYEPFFTGGVRVAVGNVRGDDAPEVVTAPGPRRPAEIGVLDLEGRLLTSFLPFGDRFEGGAFVAIGDLDGDRVCEIVVGSGEGGEPRVKVYDGWGRELRSFLAFEEGFQGGVRVAAGDLDGDGRSEIVVGAGPGGSNRVRVLDARGVAMSTFVPFDARTSNGVFVAAGDLDGDGQGELVAGTEPRSGPALVRVLDPGSGDVRVTQPVAGPAVGAHVATGDLDGDGSDELFVGSGSGIGLDFVARVIVFPASRRSFEFVPYENFQGGVYVAAPARVGPALVGRGRTITTVEGERFSGVVASFYDFARRDMVGPFSASIAWGNGSESPGTIKPLGGGDFRVLGTTRYFDAGVRPVVVTISEAHGRTVKARGQARIGAALLLAKGRSLTVRAGRSFTSVVAIVRDGNPLTPASSFRAVLRWGDGTRSAGRVARKGTGIFRVVGRHGYEKPGRYRVVVRVRDVEGRTTTTSSRIRATR